MWIFPRAFKPDPNFSPYKYYRKDLPSETRAGTAPWSSQNDTQETITNMQQGI